MSDQQFDPWGPPEDARSDHSMPPPPPDQPHQPWQQPGYGAAPMTPWQQGGPQLQGQRVEAKNPALAVIASFFLPGLGTMLNGEATKGVVMRVAWLISWFGFVLLAWILIGFLFHPVALGVWIWGMVDAHQGARVWNARHGIIS